MSVRLGFTLVPSHSPAHPPWGPPACTPPPLPLPLLLAGLGVWVQAEGSLILVCAFNAQHFGSAKAQQEPI